MKKILSLLIVTLAFATLSRADSIQFSLACNDEQMSCVDIEGGIYQTSMTLSLGSVTLEFTSPIATNVVQSEITDYESTYGTGGGFVLLLDNSSNAIGEGIFLPGATSEQHPGRDSFDGQIQFFYLNALALGLSPGITQGTGSFDYSRDHFLGDDGLPTNLYDLQINGADVPLATPEPASIFLMLGGFCVMRLRKSRIR